MEETLHERALNRLLEDISNSSAHFSERERNELSDSLRECMAIIRSDGFENGLFQIRIETQNASTATEIIKYLIKSSSLLLKIIEVSGTPPLLQFILKVIVTLGTHFFSQDIVSEVAQELRLILDESFMRRCRATNKKFEDCLRYIDGLPLLNETENDRRKTCINRLASDLPILTGIEEIAELAEEIRKIVGAADAPCKTNIMDKLQVYCCLVTFRELFLLARFAVEVDYNPRDRSILEVIYGQRRDDEKLLRFLYKPNFHTIDAFLKCDLNESSILDDFLQRRHLTRNIDDLDGQRFKIYSVHYPESLLSSYDFLVLSCLRCNSGTEGDHTIFSFRHVQDDVYTIQPYAHPENRVYSRDWVRIASNPDRRLSEWRIIKIEPENAGGDPFYLMVLASDEKSFIFTDYTGRVYTWKRAKGDRKCLWRLQRISE